MKQQERREREAGLGAWTVKLRQGQELAVGLGSSRGLERSHNGLTDKAMASAEVWSTSPQYPRVCVFGGSLQRVVNEKRKCECSKCVHTRGRGFQKTTMCKPRRVALENANTAHTLILDFQPSRAIRKINTCRASLPCPQDVAFRGRLSL